MSLPSSSCMFSHPVQFRTIMERNEGLLLPGFNTTTIGAVRVRLQVLEGTARDLQDNHSQVPKTVLDEITGLRAVIQSYDRASQLPLHVHRGGMVFQTGLESVPRHAMPVVSFLALLSISPARIISLISLLLASMSKRRRFSTPRRRSPAHRFVEAGSSRSP